LQLCGFGRLGEVGLEFDCGDREAVQEEPEVDRILVAVLVFQLRNHAQAVRGVAVDDLLIV